MSRPTICRRVLSPIVFYLIDGNGIPIAQLVYNLESDIVTEVLVVQGAGAAFPNEINGNGLIIGNRERFLQARIDTKCHIRWRTTRIPPDWVLRRELFAAERNSMYRDSGTVQSNEFRLNEIIPAVVGRGILPIPFGYLHQLRNQNPAFQQLHTRYQHGQIRNSNMGFEALPLEIVAILINQFDGRSIVSAWRSAETVENTLRRVISLDSFSDERCQRIYIHELNDITAMKILMGYDVRFRNNGLLWPEPMIYTTWKTVFSTYLEYPSILERNAYQITQLQVLGERVSEELMRFYNSNPAEQGHAAEIRRPVFYYHIESGGGGTYFSVCFPNPTSEITSITLRTNYGLQTCESTLTRDVAYRTNQTFVASKLVYFPINRNNMEGEFIPDIDRILFAINEQYITVFHVLGQSNIASPNKWWITRLNVRNTNVEFVFEVHKNILAIWVDPAQLAFYAISTDARGRQYELVELYNLDFTGMDEVFNKISNNRQDYIVEVQEYPGTINYEDDRIPRILEQYPFGQPRNVYYGIAFISHLYGTEIFKPALMSDDVEVESHTPRFYPSAFVNHLTLVGAKTVSGNGHGIYVFCNERIITISYDTITWHLGLLDFNWLPIGAVWDMHCLEVLSNDLIVLAVNDYLVIYKITLTKNPPVYESGFNQTELVLNVLTMRRICLEIDVELSKVLKVELNFERGAPFFFVTLTGKNDQNGERVGNQNKPLLNDVRFLRVDFD